jgi:hypothetical protein
MRGPIRVVFIAGATRSGSTILDRILASTGEAVAVGEIGDFWDIWGHRSHMGICGCTAEVHECPFWSEVYNRAFGPYDAVAYSRRKAVSRRIKAAFYPSLWRSFEAVEGAAELRSDLARFYYAVAEVAGVGAIVDATKYPAHALALSGVEGIRLSILHLVRDSRGVAFSWARGTTSSVPLNMRQVPPLLSAWRWNRDQLASESLSSRSDDYVRVRYEDFAREPAAFLRSVTGRLGLSQPAVSAENSVELGVDHILRANPGRFLEGEIPIREDDEWKTAMRRRDKLAVTAITLPLLMRYGYAPRRRPA